jgi:hypothetical protein
MPFNVAVQSAGRGTFPIKVDGDMVTSFVLMGLIESSKTGVAMGFVAGDWRLFPADVNGKKEGSDPFGDFVDIAPPPDSSIVHVWVEPKVPTTAGEALHDECGSPRPRTANVARSSFPPRFLLHPLAGVVAAPQTGKSNPHARDAGARAWRETETPLRFRRPLVRPRRRPPCRSPFPPCLVPHPSLTSL